MTARSASAIAVVNDVPPDKRDIAMVFQNYALYPHMTVFENLAFPLKARDRRIAAAEDRAQGGSGSPARSASATSCTATPRNCPAASSSASRWAAP